LSETKVGIGVGFLFGLFGVGDIVGVLGTADGGGGVVTTCFLGIIPGSSAIPNPLAA
jgi:hypothetical protein